MASQPGQAVAQAEAVRPIRQAKSAAPPPDGARQPAAGEIPDQDGSRHRPGGDGGDQPAAIGTKRRAAMLVFQRAPQLFLGMADINRGGRVGRQVEAALPSQERRVDRLLARAELLAFGAQGRQRIDRHAPFRAAFVERDPDRPFTAIDRIAAVRQVSSKPCR
jgi:hypothetical protein